MKSKVETVNKGKECWYKDEKHFIVYEADNITLITKSKDLTKVFCVQKKQVTYVRKKTK